MEKPAYKYEYGRRASAIRPFQYLRPDWKYLGGDRQIAVRTIQAAVSWDVGLPDVPFTKGVAIPAASSLSYRPIGPCGSESGSMWQSSSESVMRAPDIGGGSPEY